jgi:hypothetical protein
VKPGKVPVDRRETIMHLLCQRKAQPEGTIGIEALIGLWLRDLSCRALAEETDVELGQVRTDAIGKVQGSPVHIDRGLADRSG